MEGLNFPIVTAGWEFGLPSSLTSEVSAAEDGASLGEISVWVSMYPIIVHLGPVYQSRLIKLNFLSMAELIA